MVRFSVEEDEEPITIQSSNNKRRNQSIEDQNQHKLHKTQEEKLDGIENKGAIRVSVDPDTLDCFICCEPLRPPLFQCKNGHVACSTCCTKLPEDKCPTCSHAINFTRCRALEKIIESIKSSCLYSKYGCKRILSYIDILPHQEACGYAPCFCPMLNCKFCGFPQQVSTHFVKYHGDSAIEFQYGKQMKLYLEREKPFIVLHEKHGLLFLLLNERLLEVGNALSVACVNQSLISECHFMYDIKVSGEGGSLQLKSLVENVRQWLGVYPRKNFLLVPENFCSFFGEIVVDVSIQRKGVYLP